MEKPMSKKGSLYLVATPIGNLKDMSSRAIEVLSKVQLIAAEDTRNSIKLLNHFGIKSTLTSYHEHNKIEKAAELIRELEDGKDVALISDAGMPGICDPGEELVAMAYKAGIKVSVIPGACAFVSALAISGLSSKRFVFEGFLPTDKKFRRSILEELKLQTRTTIYYEAPHRLLKTLKELGEYLEASRRISIVRELTKLYEEVYINSIGEAIEFYESKEATVKGEYVLIVEGRSLESLKREKEVQWESLGLEEHLHIYENQGIDKKEAMKLVARDRNISKRDVYNALLENKTC